MLVIEGIHKLKGATIYGRLVSNVTVIKNKCNESFYSITFSAIGNGLEWNKEFEVRLAKEESVGLSNHYDLFVMGLAVVTEIQITKEDMRSAPRLASNIAKVMATAKHWWETEANKR
jgi:hypothetical protein